MKYYEVWGNHIKEIEIVRETDSFVFIEQLDFRGNKKNIRHLKKSYFNNYFPTWKEAHDFLVSEAMAKVNNARIALGLREDELEKIKAMREEGLCSK